ncbi:MAG: hypothetical protein Q9165_004524 [Trypethelium subeluteriae]
MLYSKNGRIYVTARTQEKADKAIHDIKTAVPQSSGSLVPLLLDLADLPSIKASAERFLAAEMRLHVLFNNAGLMGPEQAVARTAQGYEEHLGVNCLGPFLFTKLLTPTLVATAKDTSTAPGTVRVIFLSSFAAELFAEKSTALQMDNLDYHISKAPKYRYGVSKAGDWAYAVELSKRLKGDGIIGLAVNPGNLKSELFRHQSALFKLLTGPTNYPVVNGAYTELFAGLSPTVTVQKAGSYVGPFGRLIPFRSDLEAATRSEATGGNGTTEKFWDWSQEQVSKYE